MLATDDFFFGSNKSGNRTKSSEPTAAMKPEGFADAGNKSPPKYQRTTSFQEIIRQSFSDMSGGNRSSRSSKESSPVSSKKQAAKIDYYNAQ